MFILCKTVILEVFYKAAVITLAEITFWRKKNDKYFLNWCIEPRFRVCNIS